MDWTEEEVEDKAEEEVEDEEDGEAGDADLKSCQRGGREGARGRLLN